MTKASQKQGQSIWKNEAKASAKIRQSKSAKTSQKQAKSMRSDIKGRRLPKDVLVNKDHQKSTEPPRQSTTDFCLSCWLSNEIQKDGEDRVYTIESYREAKCPPGGSLLTQ